MAENRTDTDQLRRSLAALKGLRTRLEKLEREPIAIVGMGCRFPGGADDPGSFQRLLHDGVDAVREAPPGRWDLDTYYDPDPESPGKTYVREGAFLDRIDLFDPQFFGIAPREAATMDPQQRLLLEVAWEAIEDAGRPPRALAADHTGIFVGLMNNDYSRLIFERSPAESLDAYVATGNGLSFLTGRLAYFLGVQGPNMVVATECSSSAVALHLACQSLRAGECRTALAGGVNVLVSPKVQVIMSRMKAVAPDGRSKTFDARADGFGRGEGCGVVVLRRLSDALADRDRILALVRGSAFNHDGRSNGLTAPNGAAQQSVIRAALERAGVEGAAVGYVETHGTGTSLGDPIEVEALAAVLCAGRSPEHPLVISSVKTNIGHLEAAAGIAAVIKAVLVLRHEEIPPHLHLRRLNPLIAGKMASLAIPTEPMPWPRTDRRRLVGVSSFGMSGINAHVVLEEAPPEDRASDAAGQQETAVHLLTLSAKAPAALQQLAERHERHLEAAAGTSMADISFTSIAGRAHFGHRLAVVAGTPGEARAALSAWRQGKRPPGRYESPGDVSDAPPRVAFLFTGQGAQYAGMGRGLYETEPVFRRALDRCDEVLRGHLDEPLLAVLYPPEGRESPIDQTAYAQPALFALSYALTELWASWGVKPDAVLGHSVGEYAAAWAAGALGLEDGLKLIAARGRLMQALPGEGAMAVAFADAESLAPALAAHGGAVSIAALNGPQNTVLSGARPALEAVLEELGAAGLKTRRLRVSQAFHSSLMEPMTEELERLAAGLSYGTPRLELVSNLTGQPFEKPPDAAYWRSHVRQPVLFAAGVEGLFQRGCEVFVEIGPSSSLLSMARRLDAAGERLYLPSLRQGHDEHRTLLGSLAALYVRGIDLDAEGFDPGRRRHKVALPAYPFQRRRYWIEEARPAPAAAGRAADPVLGERVQSALSGEVLFQSVLSLRRWPFLSDHRVYGLLVVPAAVQLAMALAAAERLAGGGGCEIAGTVFPEALLLDEDEERPAQMAVAPPEGRQRAFHLFTQAAGGGAWTSHASGQMFLGPLAAVPDRGPVALEPIRSRLEEASIADFRSRSRELGLELGPAFQGLTALWCGAGESLGEIEALATGDDWFHPVWLDACFQVLGAAFESTAPEGDDLYVPFEVRRVVVHSRPGRRFWCHARAGVGAAGHGETRAGDLSVLDPAGRVIAEVEGLCVKRASRAALTRILDEGLDDWLYEVAWTPRALDEETLGAEPEPRRGCWLLFTDRESVGEALAARLEARGEPCLRISPGSGYQQLESRRYRLDPGAPEDFRRLLDELPEGGPLLGVVHLWSLDAGREEGGALAALRHGVGSVLHLVQALDGSGRRPPRLWLVTRGAQPVTGEVPGLAQSPLWGLAKVIDLEHPDLECTCVDLDPAGGDAAAQLWRELASEEPETQVAFREGRRWVARLVRQAAHCLAEGWLKVPDSGHFRLERGRRGTLEDLAFQSLPEPVPGPGEVAIRVRAAGLNFRDVLNALDMYPGDAGLLGLEASGTVTALGEGVDALAVGDEVLAVVPGSFATAVVADAQLVVRMPPGMSFEEAATLPVAFLTASYALGHMARLSAGQRVLIHAAAGGVGLAAVQLAQSVGAKVFATASPGKWAYLHGLGVEHVLSSRSPEGFAAEIRRRTGGEGVDVVLNSLSGEWIPLSLSVLAAGGCFVEIGKRGIWDAERVAAQRRDVTYRVMALDEMIAGVPGEVGGELGELAGRFARGELQPLRQEVFAPQRLLGAFRHMQHARHVGKVVIAQPDVAAGRFRPRASYLITGGLGGLGLLVARWAVERGARHLVLVGRREPSAAARETIDALRKAGAEIAVRSADVTRREELEQVLSEIGSSLPPLAGVIHAAGVLDDGVLTQQSWERFERVLAPKVEGAWNLHELTRELALDFFVLFSSAASVVGSPGQGNYSAANAFLDALAHHRRAQGLPAQSINWGAWSEIGAAAAKAGVDRLRRLGAEWIPPRQGLRALGRLLAEGRPQVAVLPADWRKFLATFSGRREPAYFSQMRREVRQRPAAGSAGDEPALLRELEMARPGERREILVERLREQAGTVLGLEPGAVDPGQDLSRLGLDSLMAVELRNAVGIALARKLSATLLFDHPTIDALAGFLAAEGLVPKLDEEEAPEGDGAARETLDDISSAELRALLDSELAQLSGLAGGSE